jgi:hypothetical protein
VNAAFCTVSIIKFPMNEMPDYKKYTYFELMDALDHIDIDLFPDRVKAIKEEIYYLQSRFPPSATQMSLLEEKSKAKEGFFEKLFINWFSNGYRLVECFGSVQAEISSTSSDAYQEQCVSASMVEKDQQYKLKISGSDSWSDSNQEVSVLLGPNGVSRLRLVLDKFENAIEKKA